MEGIHLNIALITHTPTPEKVIAAAARLCYSNDTSINLLMEYMDDEKAAKLIRKLKKVHHETPFEHVTFTFAVEGVSRALLAQITRHRIASFSVRSQRYCEENGFEYVEPESIRASEQKTLFDGIMVEISRAYRLLVEHGIPKEDARMILPNACVTRFMVTMNVRELYHFFALRCCNRAQWEIRELADGMLNLCKAVSPVLFEDAGANCEHLGYCPEGTMSCGKAKMKGGEKS